MFGRKTVEDVPTPHEVVESCEVFTEALWTEAAMTGDEQRAWVGALTHVLIHDRERRRR